MVRKKKTKVKVKSETELKRLLVGALCEEGFSARRIESAFIKGFPDLYISKNTKVTWIEVKFDENESGKRWDEARSKTKLLKACTALQIKFLKEEAAMGVSALALMGYYVGDDIVLYALKWRRDGQDAWLTPEYTLDEFVGKWMAMQHGK